MTVLIVAHSFDVVDAVPVKTHAGGESHRPALLTAYSPNRVILAMYLGFNPQADAGRVTAT